MYGLSEPNIPTVDLLKGIKPKFIVQKVVDGLQHPTGDGLRLESMADAVDVEHIQIYLQDMYLEWPYETKDTLAETLEDYYVRVLNKLETMQRITGDDTLKSIISYFLMSQIKFGLKTMRLVILQPGGICIIR